MFESGHARLLVAFIVAMGLHGLFFVWPSPQRENPSFPSMQVELLGQPRTSSAVAAKSAGSPSPILRPVQKNASTPQHILAKESTHEPVLQKQIVKLSTSISVQKKEMPKSELVASKSKPLSQKQRGMRDAKDADMVMPVDVQKKILTRVSYPMRARRRGWEGRAEFRINVRAKGIQHVTMLLSTGYDLLDHAAQKGIVSIGSLPLSDGFYRFPVVFRLQ
jgi:TonB family protein